MALQFDPPDLLTEKAASGPPVTQFSVFIHNKVGRLLEVIKILAQANIHAVALTILDTSDAAIVRLIVDDPENARVLFNERGLAFTENRVLVVELTSSGEDLQPLLMALLQSECNLHSCIPLLIRPHGKAAFAIHVEDPDIAASVLVSYDFTLLTQGDISR